MVLCMMPGCDTSAGCQCERNARVLSGGLRVGWTDPDAKPGDPPWWLTDTAAAIWRMGYEAAKADLQRLKAA